MTDSLIEKATKLLGEALPGVLIEVSEFDNKCRISHGLIHIVLPFTSIRDLEDPFVLASIATRFTRTRFDLVWSVEKSVDILAIWLSGGPSWSNYFDVKRGANFGSVRVPVGLTLSKEIKIAEFETSAGLIKAAFWENPVGDRPILYVDPLTYIRIKRKEIQDGIYVR